MSQFVVNLCFHGYIQLCSWESSNAAARGRKINFGGCHTEPMVLICDTGIGYTAEGSGLDSLHEQEVFLFSAASGPNLGPTQPPMQWVLGVKAAATWSWLLTYILPKPRMVELYLHSYLCLHGIPLNKLSTGTTLPLLLPCWNSNRVSPNTIEERCRYTNPLGEVKRLFGREKVEKKLRTEVGRWWFSDIYTRGGSVAITTPAIVSFRAPVLYLSNVKRSDCSSGQWNAALS
jgi:hypothetical protein